MRVSEIRRSVQTEDLFFKALSDFRRMYRGRFAVTGTATFAPHAVW